MKTPVSVVTGYLGSGKTTLISRLLTHPEMDETAVIVNELGEVGIDHHIVSRVDERTVLLASGCLCCTLRGDLADELRDLVNRRDAGEVPQFRRIVVETTGLADPTPIVNTLLAEPMLRHQVELDSVVATVDAMHGLRGPESLKQAAIADVLVVTKTDLADGTEVGEELARLNPAGERVEAVLGEVAPSRLFGRPPHDPAPIRDTVSRGEIAHRHDRDIRAVAVTFEEPLDRLGLGVWLTMLLQARGQDVLRVKGFLDVGGDGPLLVNAVQHVVHDPVHLPAWPDGDRRSRLVFIGRGFTAAELKASLTTFCRAAARPSL
ncbi:MAG TPA: GTP-binding protein [Gaiellaceae bacterium]